MLLSIYLGAKESVKLYKLLITFLFMLWAVLCSSLLFISHKDVNEFQDRFLSSVQFSHPVVLLFSIPWTAACQASLYINNSQTTQTHVYRAGDAIQPSHVCYPFSSHLQSFLASGSFQMSWHQVSKVLEFQLQH